ncbi:transposable element Tcb2 transposase [Trichonephila clavipes]|uniref:Transposable element Tcb2 transposase n=1 Tax=Trichonephila clavipes TaxID=2585209 RepID=A0A8X6V2H2_TRICX|nr:transposable element Tcb2 transposase [Trichonephila clavipes]
MDLAIMNRSSVIKMTARGGSVRSTTPAEDRYIVLSAKRNRRTTAQQVANQFLAASGKQISRKTVARRLRGGGLYAPRPVVCVPLTRQHRTARLQWCREHHNWTEQDWACVLFSDESRFSLSLDCRRQLIWRESGTAYRPENIQEKDRYPTCSIMVWAGIMINGCTRLHVVANGTMTGQRYIDEVLLPHVRLFRGAVGDKFVFMDDNTTCHRTLAVQDCLDSEGIQRLVWPARSPDLNPIESVWDALGRQVAGRNYPPTNKNTLIRGLTEEWDKLPQQLLDNVVQSMNRRQGKEIARGGKKEERGLRVTCVISVKKLDNCPRLRLVNLPTFRLGVLFPRHGNIISGHISCSLVSREWDNRNRWCDERVCPEVGQRTMVPWSRRPGCVFGCYGQDTERKKSPALDRENLRRALKKGTWSGEWSEKEGKTMNAGGVEE